MTLDPWGPSVNLAPCGPTETDPPDLLRFSVTPGKIFIRLKKRKPMILRLSVHCLYWRKEQYERRLSFQTLTNGHRGSTKLGLGKKENSAAKVEPAMSHYVYVPIKARDTVSATLMPVLGETLEVV